MGAEFYEANYSQVFLKLCHNFNAQGATSQDLLLNVQH